MTESIVTENTAINGGGIAIAGSGTLSLAGSTLKDNIAGTDGGGINNEGTVTITGSTISGNIASDTGGAIRNNDGANLTLARSTVSGNISSGFAGGIYNVGALTLTNSTIGGNAAGADGGGIRNDSGTLTLRNTTVANNTTAGNGGGGIDNAAGTVTLINSIVGGNNPPGRDCSGTFTSAGHNLDSDGSCGLAGPGDISGGDPRLGPLQDNGGPTLTHALGPGSPATNTGNPGTPGSGGNACEASDQRGIPRPQGTACDIGAYERVSTAPVAVSDAYSFQEGSILTVIAPGVLANDEDAEGDPLTARLVGPPSHGIVALTLDGSFIYLHDRSETLSDSFTYVANDGNEDSNVATVTITVVPIEAPQAVDDAYEVEEGESLNVAAPGVLTNDVDAQGSPLTAKLIDDVAHGTLDLKADGSFSYKHDDSETRSDSFTYVANNGPADSNVARVTITVSPVDDPPVATGDSYNVTAGGALAVPAPGVLANDSNAEGKELEARLIDRPSHGTMALTPSTQSTRFW